MSATLNAYLLYRGLAKADVYHFSRKSAVFFVKVLVAAIAMGAAVCVLQCLKSTNGRKCISLCVFIDLFG